MKQRLIVLLLILAAINLNSWTSVGTAQKTTKEPSATSNPTAKTDHGSVTGGSNAKCKINAGNGHLAYVSCSNSSATCNKDGTCSVESKVGTVVDMPMENDVKDSSASMAADQSSKAGYLRDGRYLDKDGKTVNKTSCSTGWVKVKDSNPPRYTCAGTVSGTGPLDGI